MLGTLVDITNKIQIAAGKESIKSKLHLVCSDCPGYGQILEQKISTTSMEKGPIAAVPSPVLREESQPWFSQAQEQPTQGELNTKRNILVA